MKRILVAAMLAVAALTTAACGERIRFDEAAVEVRESGKDSGVQEQEIPTGRYWAPPFSYRYIVKFPTTLQTYTWNGNNCFHFINKDKVSTTACLAMTVDIVPSQADNIVRKYKGAIARDGGEDGYVLDDVVNGPIAREVQNALNYLGNQYTTEQLYADGGRALITEVTRTIAPAFRADGINIRQIMWASPPGLPEDIVGSIRGALKAQTDAVRSRAELERTVAEGNKTRAEADAQAYATERMAQAIRSNPEVLRLEELKVHRGLCPLSARVCVIGSGAGTIISDTER